MGCNCKKNTQVYNNLNSKDHLQAAYEVYEDVIRSKSEEDMDDLDKKQILFGFYTLYPNVKTEVSISHAISSIKSAIEANYGRK